MKVKFDIKKSILIIIAAIVFAGVLYVNNKVLIISFEQLLFGLMKIKGSGSSTVLYGFIYIMLAFVIVCPIILLPIIDFGKKIVINIKNKCIHLYPIRRVKLYGVCLLILSFILLLNEFKLFPFIKNTIFSSTDLFDKYYVESSSVDITFPTKKKNLIYIFVESLESSNVSAENGGLFDESIIPNLEQLALDNVNFSNNDKIGGAYYSYGTNWTTGAMIAHTSGIPLKITLNDFNNDSTKFSNVTSIGDILSSNGYNNYLLFGSDAAYGGRKAYFDNHNYTIKDYYTAIDDEIIDKDYYEWWGYEDAKLFDYAKKILSDISKEDKPFNFTMLTADTHFTDGYLDESCVSKFDEPYSNAFHCSDDKIYKFLEWIKQQDFYDNTTIVITGDHLTMQDGFYDSEFNDRTIFNVFINADIIYREYDYKNRLFTVMDMFPTTIAALGATIEGDRLGLGTNLFSDKQTIPEIMGVDKFNDELSKWSNYYYDYIRK